MKTVKKIGLIVVAFMIFILVESSFVITYENEYSLVRQFGKIDHVVSEAGISFKASNHEQFIMAGFSPLEHGFANSWCVYFTHTRAIIYYHLHIYISIYKTRKIPIFRGFYFILARGCALS